MSDNYSEDILSPKEQKVPTKVTNDLEDSFLEEKQELAAKVDSLGKDNVLTDKVQQVQQVATPLEKVTIKADKGMIDTAEPSGEQHKPKVAVKTPETVMEEFPKPVTASVPPAAKALSTSVPPAKTGTQAKEEKP